MNWMRSRPAVAVTAAVAVTGLALFGFGQARAGSTLADVGAWAGVLAVFAGSVQAALAWLTYLQGTSPGGAAGQLDAAHRHVGGQVREYLRDEVDVRRLRGDMPLRLRWRSAGTPPRVRQLPDLDGDDESIAELFRSLRVPRLAVVGDAGSGKSTLVLLLMWRLMTDPGRRDDEPVPVLLSLVTWTPKVRLRRWIAEQIVRDYPALRNREAFGRTAGVDLVRSGRLVPVLDGLDELPADAQRLAMAAFDLEFRSDEPLVVTCRAGQSWPGIDELNAASIDVIRLVDVDPDDAFRYLSSRRPEHWAAFIAAVRERPGMPVPLALRTPLVVSLLHEVYGGDADPMTLINDATLADEAAVRRHLFGGLVLAASATQHRRQARQIEAAGHTDPPPAQHAERLERWLSHLAREVATANTVSWWHIGQRVRWPAVAAGAALGAATTTVITGDGYVAVVASAVCAVTVAVGQPRQPHWFVAPGRRAVPAMLGRLIGWALLGAAGGGVAVCLFGSVFYALVDQPSADGREEQTATVVALGQHFFLIFGTAAGAVLGALVTFVVLPMAELVRPERDQLAASPESVLAGDRLVAALRAAVHGVAAGLTGLLAAGLAAGFVRVWQQQGEGWQHPSSLPGVLADPFLLAGAAAAAAGVVTLARSAWGAYACARLVLAARGRLPLRTMRTLRDAHRLGLLHRAGPAYRFRHDEFADWLAERG